MTTNVAVPPMTTATPQVPAPQTVEGYLSFDGLPSGPEMKMMSGLVDIPDIGPMPMVVGRFDINVNDETNKDIYSTTPIREEYSEHWRVMLWYLSDFCDVDCHLRFHIIGSPRLTGRLIIYWAPVYSNQTLAMDTQLRIPLAEWDLSKSDYIDVYPPILRRLPRIHTKYYHAEDVNCISDWVPLVGSVRVQILVPPQGGSVLPDTWTIFCYKMRPGLQLYCPTDMCWRTNTTYFGIFADNG